MNIFTVACISIPMIGLGRTVVQNWDTVKWIHFPRHYEAVMARQKKSLESWRMKDGREVLLKDMEDSHLANAIRMVARQCNQPGYLGEMVNNPVFKRLIGEGKRRKFKVTLMNTPIVVRGKKEYVEVWVPPPKCLLASGFLPSEWDSRPQE